MINLHYQLKYELCKREEFKILLVKGTDSTMLQKLYSQHQESRYFIQMKSQALQAFGIHHFAGPVFYSTQGNHQLSVLQHSG